MFNNILVLCTGNICRSPFAQAKLMQLLPQLQIDSAGIATEKSGLQGVAADATAIKVAADFGLVLSEHKAKQVTQELIDQYDLILTMERNQIEQLCEMFPYARSKSFLFGHWVGISCIDDPYKQGPEAFVKAFSTIESAAQAWARKLK